MKLVLYSGGQTSENRILHQALSELAGSGRRKSMTYIPFCAEGSNGFFRRSIRRYEKHGFTRFQCLPVDQPILKKDLEKALESDVIYLAGGNTFYFLKHLRESGLVPKLRRYAREGGVLAGLSAGAIIMTPTIELAGHPKADPDRNEVRLKDLRGLSLTRFEFHPHYEKRRGLDRALMEYSLTSKHPVLAAEDGGGILVDGNRLKVLGKVSLFQDGYLWRIEPGA